MSTPFKNASVPNIEESFVGSSEPVFVELPSETTDNSALPKVPRIYESHFSNLLLSHEQIQSQIKHMANLINDQYPNDEPLVLVCVLKGASPFFQSLCNELSILGFPYMTEFMRISSYVGTKSSGQVNVDASTKSMKNTCLNRNVIVVEDIVDTGTTLQQLIPILKKECKPKSIEICAMVHKRLDDDNMISGNKVVVRYAGFTIPNAFIVGFGLDYNEMYRDLRDIWILGEKGIQFGGWVKE